MNDENEVTMTQNTAPDRQIKKCQNCKNAELYLEGLYCALSGKPAYMNRSCKNWEELEEEEWEEDTDDLSCD